jgi:hypothetical protein
LTLQAAVLRCLCEVFSLQLWRLVHVGSFAYLFMATVVNVFVIVRAALYLTLYLVERGARPRERREVLDTDESVIVFRQDASEVLTQKCFVFK